MRSTLKHLLDRIRSVPHPSPGMLVEYMDRELDPKRMGKVEAHVIDCARCRERLDQLQEGMQFFRHTTMRSMPEFPLEDGLQRLQAKLQEQASDDVRPPVESEKQRAVLYSRLLSELSIYVGHRTAIQLLERCNHQKLQRDRFSEVVEPVVTSFLGKHAGMTIIANILRIWDRTQQVPS